MPEGPAARSESKTASALIARRLHQAGCRYAFGIPGGEVLAMMDALAEAGIAFTLAKHENAAGFMAEGTYHATGAPGILLATIGPGVANAVNVIANAEQDRVPLIVLTGCVPAAEALTYTHQVFDHRAVLEPITKATFTAADGAIEEVIDKAVAISMDPQPGPVHIDLPIDVATAAQPDRTVYTRPRLAPTAPALGPDLDRARRKLAQAERPVMVAGLDAMDRETAATVAQFVQDFGVPLLTTYKAKGILPEDHPLSLGGHGLSPLSDKHVMPFLAKADLALLAGYDPIEMRAGWRDPWNPEVAVEISTVPNTHFMHKAGTSFVCDVRAGLLALRDGMTPRETWPGGEPTALRAALHAAFFPDEAWSANAVFAALRRAAPRDAVATVDSGAHRILLSQMWECYEPRGLIQSTALCTMGCAVPLAIGYRLAAPDRPTIAVIGDACLEMTLGELATLRDLKLPILIVVLVDESLALIELKQRNTGLANLGVDFPGTDFPAVAEALGGVGRTVDSVEALEAEVPLAFDRDTFTVLACPIGRKAYDGRI